MNAIEIFVVETYNTKTKKRNRDYYTKLESAKRKAGILLNNDIIIRIYPTRLITE